MGLMALFAGASVGLLTWGICTRVRHARCAAPRIRHLPRIGFRSSRAALLLAGGVVTTVFAACAGRGAQHVAEAGPARASYVALSPRLSATDWRSLQEAARLRRMALAPHRTSYYRFFAGLMGLQLLLRLHPVSSRRCQVAVQDLYDNLLDLHQAASYPPITNWAPLRRAVRSEPSLEVCAPRHATSRTRITA